MSLSQKSKIKIFSLITVLFFLMAGPAVLAADSPGATNALNGLSATATGGGISTSQSSLPVIIGQVVGAILAFVGVVFFCLILWAGFGWMLAQGDETKITKAKDTIVGSVLGLIVILGAYAIVQLIANVFSGAISGT